MDMELNLNENYVSFIDFRISEVVKEEWCVSCRNSEARWGHNFIDFTWVYSVNYSQ